MNPLADRFRRWYEYESRQQRQDATRCSRPCRRCRANDGFGKAVDKMGHLVAARQRWLHRLGHWRPLPKCSPWQIVLADLSADGQRHRECMGRNILSGLDETELAREFEWQFADGRRYRWDVEGVLTQTFGHAWYHRGQIASLVASLGGKAVDTDYIFWCKLTPLS